jgi:hypothetical protein
MKTFIAIIIAAGLAGCASQQQNLDKKFMVEAGYRSETPSTPQQKAQYAALPAYKMLWNDKRPGETIYKDAEAGVIYIGNEAQYRLFLQLAFAEESRQQHAQMLAANAQVNMRISNLEASQQRKVMPMMQPSMSTSQFYRPVYTQDPPMMMPGPIWH